MAFSKTNKPCELPIYKDKVMYISSSDSNIKMEQSYVISASFNGILRLSPNSYNTIYEVNPIELTPEQDSSISTSYSDAIVFDDSAIVGQTTEDQGILKTNADIRYRMIIGSDSDGYLVGFRLSDEDVEFDNLGVIGITKTSKLYIYNKAHSAEPQAIKIGKTIMPSLPNTIENTSRGELVEILKNQSKKHPENWDEIEIDIRGEGDQSYLLYGRPDKDGNRIFEYKRSQQFIRDIIMETLLSVQSVPTGSIHWLPVTYAQYKALVSDTKSYPNHYFKKDDGGENTTNPVDPIIRDYLLCDGRKYKSSHFPELAKILWKEHITYWDKNGNQKKHQNGGKTEKKVEVDGQMTTQIVYDDYFRVPDLRAKFISYVYASSVDNPLDGEPQKIYKYKSKENNLTGLYTPDNTPRYTSGQSDAEHFHFSAYGSYTGYNITPERNSDKMYKFKGYKFTDTDLSDQNFDARVWYLQTTAGQHSYESGYDGESGIGGYSYGFGSSGDRRRSQSTNDIILATAFVSAPGGGHSSFRTEPSIGLTSKSQMIYQIPANNTETYKLIQYETFDDYNDLELGISKSLTKNIDDKTLTAETRYGHENTPKFYAMLPLIKI